ncbi:hypothetical protein [Thauera sp. SDU_THAU2]|uniref:hypothetical protein n=1 Tax=Thauera sp. SDU_THAU2 TaxID=3136633 RepID=UPI00311D3F1F
MAEPDGVKGKSVNNNDYQLLPQARHLCAQSSGCAMLRSICTITSWTKPIEIQAASPDHLHDDLSIEGLRHHAAN